MSSLRVTLLGWAMTLSACSVVNDPAKREADLNRLSTLLAQKRAAERAGGSEPRDFHYHGCPEALLGTSIEEIEKRLGTTACSEREPTCTYSFYYMPSAWTGGGQELTLTFDDTGRVSDVQCYVTQ